MREQRQVFGEVAGEYEDVRAGYADELVTVVLDYLGRVPERVVEVGAGTGKATERFAARGMAMTCLEPDPAMAAVLRGRFPGAEVVVSRFEDWVPPAGGVPLLICAQAWHWIDEATRLRLGHAALAPGGVVALFGHQYAFADPAVKAALNEVYARYAPELLDDPPMPEPNGHWLTVELAGSPLFQDAAERTFQRIVPYPTRQYVRLLTTFSNHRMLAPQQRERLHAGIAEAVDAHGGVVRTRLDTALALARRAG